MEEKSSPQQETIDEERLWKRNNALRTTRRMPVSPLRRRTTGKRGGGRNPRLQQRACTRKNLVDERCRRPAAGAEARWRRHGITRTRRNRRWRAGRWRTGGTATGGGGENLGFDLGRTALNRYDGWDQRVREVSDEPTMQKHKRRSNHRISSAPR
jgi:hypothetical protein